MLKNVLKEKIENNEKVYNDGKASLEKIISDANNKYNSLLKDYKNQKQYINNNSMLSEAGKIDKAAKLHDEFLKKVKESADKYNKDLLEETQRILSQIEKIREDNYEALKGEKLTQIVYVSSMMNSMNQIDDAHMIKEVFDYACLEGNFSTEIINLIYIKANTLLNANNKGMGRVVVDETEAKKLERTINNNADATEIIRRGDKKKILSNIIAEIKKYKNDYYDEFKEYESRFNSWLNSGKYPQNLFLSFDYGRDFRIEGKLLKNPWNSQTKKKDPWGKVL